MTPKILQVMKSSLCVMTFHITPEEVGTAIKRSKSLEVSELKNQQED